MELQVLGRDSIRRLSVDDLKVEPVFFRNSEKGGGTRVALHNRVLRLVADSEAGYRIELGRFTYRISVELTESHRCSTYSRVSVTGVEVGGRGDCVGLWWGLRVVFKPSQILCSLYFSTLVPFRFT